MLSSEQLTWYRRQKDGPHYELTHWWLNKEGLNFVRDWPRATRNLILESAHLDRAAIKTAAGDENAVQHAPLLWEILRRHPAVPALKQLAAPTLFPSGEPKPMTVEAAETVGKDLQKMWPGMDCWLIYRLLREGHLAWCSLDESLQKSLELLFLKSGIVDGSGAKKYLPVGQRTAAFDREAFVHPFALNDPKFETPIDERTVGALRDEAAGWGMEVAVIYFDRRADARKLNQAAKEILSQRCATPPSKIISLRLGELHYLDLVALDTAAPMDVDRRKYTKFFSERGPLPRSEESKKAPRKN